MEDLAVTIWVTNDCNLLCEYCYVHKKIDYMTIAAAHAAAEFIIKQDMEQNPKRIKVVFSGGEPMLNFKAVQTIMDRLKETAERKPVIYMITTNGTVAPSAEELEYFKKMSVSVSLDGMQDSNDRARKFKHTEKGSHAYAEKAILKLKALGIPIRIRMTVTPENVAAFADNYRYLYRISEQLCAFEPDIGDKRWNQEYLDLFFQQLKEIVDFMIQQSEVQAEEMLCSLKGRFFHLRSECTGGTGSFHISAMGKIYPCILATEVEEYELGSVTSGINAEKLEELKKISSQVTKDCAGCAFYHHCESKTCKLVNKYYSGSYDTPSVVKCNIQNRMYRLLMEYKSYWEEKNDHKS